MLILGVSGGEKVETAHDFHEGYYHDAAAVLLDNGNIVAAIEEERLNRIKHTNCFPRLAIQSCLDIAGVTLSDVDQIATGTALWNVIRRNTVQCLIDPARPLPGDSGQDIARVFEEQFGINVLSKLRFIDHHDSHAWSVYAYSGFTEALILCLDGVGDGHSGVIYKATGHRLERLRGFGMDQSLGGFYRQFITVLGFGNFDEYKAMGLAPYGRTEQFREFFEERYALQPEGNYRLIHDAAWYTEADTAKLLPTLRRKGQPFLQVHMDFASSLQQALEVIVMHILSHFSATTGLRNVCLAGGVAQNCTLNGLIARSGMFDQMFVQPASHDAGTALGAAVKIALEQEPNIEITRMEHVFLGADIGNGDTIQRAVERWKGAIHFEILDDPIETSAALLAQGAVLGWVQGRSEFGPRALGGRSILADPRPAENKMRINEMIKKRESFRPFAPVVTQEGANDLFDLPSTQSDLSFMTQTVPVKREMRSILGAVTHVDGSARIQVVSERSNPMLWRLLRAFERNSGVPVLLNTSLNNNVEPIVDSIDDAITCYLTTEIDYLIVGAILIRRREISEINKAVCDFAPSIMPGCRLETQISTANRKKSREKLFSVSNVKNAVLLRSKQISGDMFDFLCSANGRDSFHELIRRGASENSGLDFELTQEVIQLWTDRWINLAPPK